MVFIPMRLITEHRIQDGQQLAHGGDEGHLRSLAKTSWTLFAGKLSMKHGYDDGSQREVRGAVGLP
jgi:hypothetical protein